MLYRSERIVHAGYPSRTPELPLVVTLDREPVSAPRYLGASVSLAPGFSLDLDAGLFHGFATLGVVLPLSTNGSVIPFALGLCVGIPVSRNRAFRLDFFANLVVVGDVRGNLSDYGAGYGNWVGVGAGFGLHHTWNNGVTLGFTIPLLGCSFLVGESYSPGRLDLAEGVAFYFLTSATAVLSWLPPVGAGLDGLRAGLIRDEAQVIKTVSYEFRPLGSAQSPKPRPWVKMLVPRLDVCAVLRDLRGTGLAPLADMDRASSQIPFLRKYQKEKTNQRHLGLNA